MVCVVYAVVQQLHVVLLQRQEVLGVFLHGLGGNARRVVFVKANEGLLVQVDYEVSLLPNCRNQRIPVLNAKQNSYPHMSPLHE